MRRNLFIPLMLVTIVACAAFGYKPSKPTQCEKLIVAYEDLIYRVWIDNPDYVLDVLSESDEWTTLSELKDDNWDYVFTYKSREDSIMQSFNDQIELEDPHCYSHLDSILDVLSQKASEDRPSRPVPQIIIKNN